MSRAAGSVVDSLERRFLLSASISHRILFLVGTSGGDVIDVGTDGTTTTVRLNKSSATFADADYDRISVDARAGNDLVRIGIEIVKPTTLRGGDGNDILTGGGGDDVLLAGLGNDTLAGGGEQNAPAGINTADYSDRTEPISANGGGITTAAGESDIFTANIQRLLTGSGNDSIHVVANYRGDTTFVDAGAGNDAISLGTVGYAGHPVAHGGEGNDSILLTGSGSIAEYFGDAGDDTFAVYRSSSTAREFHGGPGNDTVDYAGSPGGGAFYSILVTLDDIPNDGSPTEYRNQRAYDNVHSDVEGVIGTYWGSHVIGSARDETLAGASSNDILFGNGGTDSLAGGAGNDVLVADGSHDTLDGGLGHDTLIALGADDEIVSDADDTIINERLWLADGTLVVAGDDGANHISVLANPDDPGTVIATLDGDSLLFPIDQISRLILIGGGGDDLIQLDNTVAASGLIVGGDGNDTISGGAAEASNVAWVSVFGGDGDDSIVGGASYNEIYGGEGNDRITSAHSYVTLSFGEDGDDTIGGGGIIDGGQGDDRISGGGYLFGGPGNDTVEGGSSNDVFVPDRSAYVYVPVSWAMLGDDSILGGDGDDRIDDSQGSNTLLGGDGNDTITAQGDEPSQIDGGNGDDTIQSFNVFAQGGPGNDLLQGYGGTLDGGDGNDTLRGGFGSETLLGGAGDDLINNPPFYADDIGSNFIDGGDGNDTLNGGNGDDTVLGGDGDDLIHAGRGNDYIDCGPGNDSAYGDDGDDTLLGGPGDDLLDGGAGNNLIIPDLIGVARTAPMTGWQPVPRLGATG